MVIPWYLVVPSNGWCSWSRWHLCPCNDCWSASDVVRTTIPFFMSLPFSGSRRSPRLHMSNSLARVWQYTSWSKGVRNMFDLWGCSQWKCLPLSLWYRNRMVPSASWLMFPILWACTMSHAWHDRDWLKFDHADHGPHSGENHKCSGWCCSSFLNSSNWPSLVIRSVCGNAKRCAWWPIFVTWLVSLLLLPQNTSNSLVVLVLDTLLWWQTLSNLSWISWRHFW